MVSKMMQIIETLMVKSRCWIYGHETMFGGAGRNEEGLSITDHLLKLWKYEMLTWKFFPYALKEEHFSLMGKIFKCLRDQNQAREKQTFM